MHIIHLLGHIFVKCLSMMYNVVHQNKQILSVHIIYILDIDIYKYFHIKQF